MIRVALLWHMHQPSYKDPIDGSVALPWVRLHALKDYLGMVEMLRDFPKVRLTFNLVPSLVDQIEEYANGTAREPLLDLSLRPAATLSADERLLALQAFFVAHEQNLIGRFPRYAELLALRGPSKEEAALRSAAARFSTQDVIDLQVLSKLAWFDRSWQETDRVVRGLIVKARGFTEEDKQRLAERERVLVQAVIPAYRRAAAEGQAELCTSPYYHPILPLLCDSEAHHEASPGAPLPRRFRHPEDAADQIERAIARHTAVFGAPPAGMWPSEGSVSEDVARLLAKAGIRWAASDEGVLERSTNRPIHRDSRGTAHPLDLLYRPWVRHTPDGDVHFLFRDRALSDLIGFSYSSLEPPAAAMDLLQRLLRIGEAWERRALPGEPVVPIILDGENAWEYFRDGGRVFLSTLYRGLSEDPNLRAVTMSEAVGSASAEPLPRVFAGSWIHANFDVWIGHADDRRAWDLLGEARDALGRAGPGTAGSDVARAWEIYRAACGSDWCWWYGEEHASENDVQFDRLYRRHLRAIHLLVDGSAPEALEEPLITTRPLEPRHSRPTGAITPVLDGRFTNPGEWVAAGVYRVPTLGATMQRGGGGVHAIRFGVGDEKLHILVEAVGALSDLLAKMQVHVTFPGPTTWRYRIVGPVTNLTLDRAERTGVGWVSAPTDAKAAAQAVIECAIPLAELRRGPEREIAFRVVLVSGQIEVERYPELAPIRFEPEEVTRDG
jgi:alpha-amylase/alpha-mannosidase (GH57 family)